MAFLALGGKRREAEKLKISDEQIFDKRQEAIGKRNSKYPKGSFDTVKSGARKTPKCRFLSFTMKIYLLIILQVKYMQEAAKTL